MVAGSWSGTVPGRGGGDAPRRGIESPGNSPQGASPKGVSPQGTPPQGKANDQPRATLPRPEPPTAGGERSRAKPNSGVRETTIPSNNNRVPSNSNRDRSGPRNDQPTFKGSAPKTEAKSNPPAGQQSRGSGREESGSGSTNGKKKAAISNNYRTSTHLHAAVSITFYLPTAATGIAAAIASDGSRI